jgi:hypothetical protein
MAKLLLADIANLENQTSAVATINANNTAIENALELTLSRDGTIPNEMVEDLDMNSNRIMNLPDPINNSEPVTLAFGLANYGNSLVNANAAAASASAASASASAAASSASSASTSATNSATSASNSASSAADSAASAAIAQAAAGTNISGMTNHGVMIATGTNSGTSLGVMTDGQLLVGQSAANPQAKTITGDVTFSAAGASTIANLAVTNAKIAASTIDLAAKVTGVLPSANGGTGVNNSKNLTVSNSLTLAGTDSTTMTFPPASASIGYLNVPQNSQSAAYTTVLADSGKHILHPSSDANARTFTIDSNANVAYPIGTVLTFINQTSQVVTIAITSDTMTLAGTTTTGSRSLSQNGIATAIKVATTSWIISGPGVT